MKTVLIIGIGQFGSIIAKRMEALRCEVMAVDISEDRISEIMPYVTNGVQCLRLGSLLVSQSRLPDKEALRMRKVSSEVEKVGGGTIEREVGTVPVNHEKRVGRAAPSHDDEKV